MIPEEDWRISAIYDCLISTFIGIMLSSTFFYHLSQVDQLGDDGRAFIFGINLVLFTTLVAQP